MTIKLCINYYGHTAWYTNKYLHNKYGPAAEFLDGTKHWWVNGNKHRLDGPAFTYPWGTKQWYFNNELHRTDGPAIEHADGTTIWYINGIQYSSYLEYLVVIDDLNTSKETYDN